AGIAERVVTVLCTRPMTGNVSSVSSDLVSNDAVLHVFLIRQAKVFFRRYVTEHRGTVPADHGCANRRSDVVVTGGDIGDQGPQRVERGLVAHLFFLIHLLFDLVERNLPRAFDHDLSTAFSSFPVCASPSFSLVALVM